MYFVQLTIPSANVSKKYLSWKTKASSACKDFSCWVWLITFIEILQRYLSLPTSDAFEGRGAHECVRHDSIYSIFWLCVIIVQINEGKVRKENGWVKKWCFYLYNGHIGSDSHSLSSYSVSGHSWPPLADLWMIVLYRDCVAVVAFSVGHEKQSSRKGSVQWQIICTVQFKCMFSRRNRELDDTEKNG